MKLSEILKICSENETADFRYSVVCGSTESQVTGITSDSRKMQDGYAFVCIKGAVSDGHKYIDQIKDKASVMASTKLRIARQQLLARITQGLRLHLCRQQYMAILIRSCLQ